MVQCVRHIGKDAADGVERKLLKVVQSSYVDSRMCVRVGNDVSEWFPINVGLRQGCVMSPWLFNAWFKE